MKERCPERIMQAWHQRWSIGPFAIMARIVSLLIIAWLLPGLVCAGSADSATVIGTSSQLADGARALQFRDYELGVRLTLEGLRGNVARRERAAALSNLCAGYAGLERYDEAIEACNRALELNAIPWRVLNNRAIAYLGKGQIQAARSDVEAGLKLNPDSGRLRKVLTMVEIAEMQPRISIADASPAMPH